MNKKTVLCIFLILSGMFGARFPASVATTASWGEISIVAIQPEFYYYYVSESDYRVYISEMIEKAMVCQPDIVVFPEYIGILLLGLYSSDINDYINYTTSQVISMTGIPPNILYYEAANVAGTAYLNTFSALARKYNVHIVAGSICLPDGEITGTPGNYVYSKIGTADEVYNIAYFFGPNGYIIGTQKKVHLWGSEQLFLKPSAEENLQVYEIDVRGIHVGVGIVICYDAWFDSVGQALVQRGADILFEVSWWGLPSMNYDPIQWVIDTIWTLSQGQVVYGVLSCLVGVIFQESHTGRSAITAPLQLTEKEDGFVSVTDKFNGFAIVPGVLDIPELFKLRGEPVAFFEYQLEEPLTDGKITFNASESLDVNGDIVSYEWDFGDGNTTTAINPIITHVYNEAGNYIVILELTDNEGLSNSFSKNIFVGLKGDLNNDSIVDILDVILAALAFNSRPGDSNWDQTADLNNDCIIDIFDIVLLANNFGKTA